METPVEFTPKVPHIHPLSKITCVGITYYDGPYTVNMHSWKTSQCNQIF